MRVLTEYTIHWTLKDRSAGYGESGVLRIVSRSKREALHELKKAFVKALYKWKDIRIGKVEERHWATDNPYSEDADYWHFRVADPASFNQKSFRTIDIPGHPGRGKFIIGKLKGEKTTTIQKVLIAKAFRPDHEEAESAAKHILGGATGFRHSNPAGSAANPVVPEGDAEDPEFPLIYGRTNRITMVKTEGKYRGQRFYHDFGEDVRQNGVIEGSVIMLPSGRQITLDKRAVLLRGPKGLWGRYI